MRVFSIRKPQKLSSWTVSKKRRADQRASGRYGTWYLKGHPAHKYILYLWKHGILLPSNQRRIDCLYSLRGIAVTNKMGSTCPRDLKLFLQQEMTTKRPMMLCKSQDCRSKKLSEIFCYILSILYSGLLLAISHLASVSTPSPTNHEIRDPKILLPWNRKIVYTTSF